MGSSPSTPEPQFDGKEGMEYPETYLMSNGKKLFIKDKESTREFACSQETINSYKISKIIINHKPFIIIHYDDGKIYHLVYYDINLNFIKRSQYKYSKKIINANVIGDDKIVCELTTSLCIIDVKNHKTKVLFFDRKQWCYQMDSNNNIFLAYNYEKRHTMTFTIRKYSSEDHYNKFTEKFYEVNTSYVYSMRLIYLHILEPFIFEYYDNRDLSLMGVYQKDDIIYVIGKDIHNTISIDEWYKDVLWFKSTILITDQIDRLYLMNKKAEQDIIHLRYASSHHCSVLCENRHDWTKRMDTFMKSIADIKKFSSDLILLILGYL